MVDPGETLSFRSRAEWRDWLRLNHSKKREIWLVHPKKNSKTGELEYLDAVEEAICFGWIDSQMRRLDDYRFVLRYSPRRP